MSKYFQVNPTVSYSSKEDISIMESGMQKLKISDDEKNEKLAESVLAEKDTLKCVYGKVIIKINTDYKNSHTFTDGVKIRRERQFNDFNRRVTEPVNAIVIDAENIPKEAEILIHPNEICDTNRIFGYKDKSPYIKYYSIQHEQCFLWKDENGAWNPLPPYETAVRIYKPYEGIMQDIPPTIIKDTLWVTSGEYKNKSVKTLKAVDYVVVFQDTNGREGQVIRFRPNGGKEIGREPEAIAIMKDLTELVLNGDVLIGIDEKNAKKLNDE